MAKSQNRQVDKVERGARLAQRQRKVEARELRDVNRVGWREMIDDNDEAGLESFDAIMDQSFG